MNKRILLLDGLHVGSIWSIMPNRYEYYEDKQKQSKSANPIQRKLYAKWREMIAAMSDVHAVIYLGECGDGCDKKSNGKYQWTSDLMVQAECAYEMLNMIDFKDKKRIYIVQGSNYHSEYNLSMDEHLAKMFRCDYGTDVYLDVNGCVFHATHFVGGAKSSLENEIDLYFSRKAENGPVDIIVRGHKHHYKFSGKRGVLALQLPSWKAKEDFSRKFGFKYEPEMGYVYVDVNDDGTYDYNAKVFTLDRKNEVIKA